MVTNKQNYKIKWWWIRHAPAIKPSGTISGHSDHRADVSNQAHFKQIVKILPQGDSLLYSSDLLRAKMTADALISAGHQNASPHQTFKEIRERNFGQWEGITFAHLEEHQPQEIHNFWDDLMSYAPPEGESLNQLKNRVQDFVLQQSQQLVDTGRLVDTGEIEKDIVVVAHDGVIRSAIAQGLGADYEKTLSIKLDNAGLTRITMTITDDGMHWFKVRCINWIPNPNGIQSEDS